MTFFDLQFEYQIGSVAALVIFSVLFTVWAIWITKIIRSKMDNQTQLFWPLGLSFCVGATIVGVGKMEPAEELVTLALAHLFAWYVIRKQDKPRSNSSE